MKYKIYCYAILGQIRIVASSGHTISSTAGTHSVTLHMLRNATTCAVVGVYYYFLLYKLFFTHLCWFY